MPNNIAYDIVIEPKMSFGTGHHQTTHLMVQHILDLDVKDKKILDMGCGTGILAILAEIRGAADIEAIDIDEWSYNNTLENIRNNNCEEIKVKMGGAELIKKNNFNVIIANINRNILLNDMDAYTKGLIEGGDLLLSGFFSSDKDILLEASSKLGFELSYQETKNDWTMLHLVKK